MTDPGARWDSSYHAPVLLDSVVAHLRGATRILDGTLGGGGHTAALLDAGASVDGIDLDSDALAAARRRFGDAGGRFRGFQAHYADIDSIPELARQRYDGILLDLGISSHQIDDAARGFSFRPGVPLDMRMNQDAAIDARALLNDSDETTLTDIFRQYGDEPRGARLAREIVRRRHTRPFATADDLVGAIRATLGPRSGPNDFARLFQAVRIAVNGELERLPDALVALRNRLLPGGRFLVIAYHSGEDRIVKNAFRDWSVACICPPLAPRCTCGAIALGSLLTKKAERPTAEETERNPRARSARLRAWSARDAT
jgi:16S rRNA (cytosine1402-N4)-methyltransferase